MNFINDYMDSKLKSYREIFLFCFLLHLQCLTHSTWHRVGMKGLEGKREGGERKDAKLGMGALCGAIF